MGSKLLVVIFLALLATVYSGELQPYTHSTEAGATRCDDLCIKCECCVVPIEYVCDSFCFCGIGYSEEVPCREGEAFDVDLGDCVAKEVAVCPDRPPSPCLQRPDGDYPHPQRCDMFVTCSNGFEYEKRCSDSPSVELHFCEGCTPPRCMWPHEAGCQRKAQCLHRGLYLDDQDCTRYYECSSGKMVSRPCPSGLHWSEHSAKCQPPSSADCKTVRNPHRNVDGTGARVSVPETDRKEAHRCTLPDGAYEVPASPALYLVCRGDLGTFHECPSGQEFSKETNSCVTAPRYAQLTGGQCKQFRERFGIRQPPPL